MFTSVNVKAISLAFSNAQTAPNCDTVVPSENTTFSLIRTTSDSHIRSDRPKSWSPNETLTNILFPKDITPEKRRYTNSSDILTCDSSPTTVIVPEGKNEKCFDIWLNDAFQPQQRDLQSF